jgi:hypothetical protein
MWCFLVASCVLRVSKVFTMCLVGRSSLSSVSLSFSAIKFQYSQFKLLFGASQIFFFVTQITPLSFSSVNQSLQTSWEFFWLLCEHNLILRYSKIYFSWAPKYFIWVSHVPKYLWDLSPDFWNLRSIFRGLNINSRLFWNYLYTQN